MYKKKSIYLILVILLVFGCKKPKIGTYDLLLDNGNGLEFYTYLYEDKVTNCYIEYNGYLSGKLSKKGSKVNGVLSGTQYATAKNHIEITLNGIIKHDGGLLKHKITGNFTNNNNESGTFEIRFRFKN